MASKRKRKARPYDPNPHVIIQKPKRIKLVGPPSKQTDGMADYVEGAEWWIARSKSSFREIMSMFDRGQVPGCLYERTGALIELGHTGQSYVIAIQLVRTGRDWDLDLTLSEIGVCLEERWDGVSEVTVSNYVV